jgi:hypothetical protein
MFVAGSKWEFHEITFNVSRYPDRQGLTRMAVDEVVEQAFATWASETNLTFRQVSEHADINIAFIEANESHIKYFRNRTIFGYTYRPSIGYVYLNVDWGWTIRNSSGEPHRQLMFYLHVVMLLIIWSDLGPHLKLLATLCVARKAGNILSS